MNLRICLPLALSALIAPLAHAAGSTAAAERVGSPYNGQPAGGGSHASVSANGRFVVYLSLVDGQGQELPFRNVFVHDRQLDLIELVSVSTQGAAANNICNSPSITEDGRFVVFSSDGSNLVPGDTNDIPDTFVRDRLSGTTERVSVSNDGQQHQGGRFSPNIPAISADGRFVVFSSFDQTLAPGDDGSYLDVFVRDRTLGTTERINVAPAAEIANAHSFGGSISADGRFVTFDSYASNLVPNDTDELDVYVRDRLEGTTELVSVSSAEVSGNGRSSQGRISADGRFVAFLSEASNLVAGDTNTNYDVFVRDREAGTTERVSVSSAGGEGNEGSGWEFGGDYVPMRLSADGRFVLFTTQSTNLVRGKRLAPGTFLLHDRALRTTVPAVLSSNKPITGMIAFANLSANGRYLVVSTDKPLERQDRNGSPDLYLVDRKDPGSGVLTVKAGPWKVVPAGAVVPGGVRVTNKGKGSLTFSVAGITGPFSYAGGAGPFTLGPRQSRLLLVAFQAETSGRHEGTLTLNSDDTRQPTLVVNLRALAK